MNINGSGTYVSKIDRLIADYEAKIDALRLARELIYGTVREKKTQRNDALTMALHQEATHSDRPRSHHAPKVYKRGPYKKHTPHKTIERKTALADQRQRSADFLAKFDTKQPAPPPADWNGSERGPLGVLVRRGYLKKRGDGYIRTAKPFKINGVTAHALPKRALPKGALYKKEQQRRQRTANFLLEFDEVNPKTSSSPLLASVLRHGYLRKVDDGFLRTAKEFHVVRA